MLNQLKSVLPKFLIDWYHFFWAAVSAVFYGFPSRKLRVIGITGTKGKSSTLVLAGRILEKAGYKVASISSLSFKIDQKEYLNQYHITMPGRGFIQKFMREAVNKGCQFFLLEVTSEGIKQYRHKFINFDTAVFTNLQPEHIEAHGGFENYKNTKKTLFLSPSASKTIVVNLDDQNGKFFLKSPAKSKIGFSLHSDAISALVDKIIKPSQLKITPNNISFKIENVPFKLNLLGEFNVYNALTAIAIALVYDVNLETIKKALEEIEKIEGRMEEIKTGQDFKVFVDFAHTPDSFKAVFEAVKLIQQKNSKIIAVFGATGGGRDKWKRPVLGEIASQYADVLILTNDDPYNESPQQIIEEIAKGIPLQKPHFKIQDRRKAIKKALSLAKNKDIVLILGMGSETTYIKGGKKYPWDDREATKQELAKILKKNENRT